MATKPFRGYSEVALSPYKQEVAGSNPAPPIVQKPDDFGFLTQRAVPKEIPALEAQGVRGRAGAVMAPPEWLGQYRCDAGGRLPAEHVLR